uniref:Lipocalin/cytosolic fatty-acid binding domain-containing protein n=1 Tax=Anopheles culicifacies TaxID=139723 RepID=A0A182LVL2_9DIPT
MTLSVTALVCLAGVVQGHTYKTGECPSVEPMSGFSMKQFLLVENRRNTTARVNQAHVNFNKPIKSYAATSSETTSDRPDLSIPCPSRNHIVPATETMKPNPEDLRRSKFLGIWYVIQKTGTASSCVIYNITKNADTPDEYFIEQISQKAPLSITPIKHEYSYTGKLTVTDRDVPARMTVRFPLSLAGSAKFVVFMTDYDTYAGVFSCQKIPFGHRQSATLLSRTRDLDKIFVDKIRTRLSSYSVDPFDLSIVNQTGCPKEGEAGWNIHIDPDTFSTRNIANAFRKAGEAIGDGFEAAVNAGKKVHLF